MQQEIIAAWMFTVNNQLGMFQNDEKLILNPLISLDDEEENPPPEDVSTGDVLHESAQDVWLKFLTRRYEGVAYYSKEQVMKCFKHNIIT